MPSCLPDPRGVALQEAFKFSFVRMSPFGSVVSYTANIPQNPMIFTDSGPPIK